VATDVSELEISNITSRCCGAILGRSVFGLLEEDSKSYRYCVLGTEAPLCLKVACEKV